MQFNDMADRRIQYARILWGFEPAAGVVLFPEEIPESGLYLEGARKTITVNAYERDTAV
ncbi:hypothetical protein [Bordetella bronchiseptica]|uniref:Uncharacterized protein n=3 Tax=Bordetella bronchiseptica TaxID=518 RepID=A0A0H3LIL1_BORBR|nr:hypothetical protein [Bordetella bronchiseptica]AUV49738.1 hypothetical protein AL472_25290 [Bordetella bronchiseptica]AWP73420.1 hypothetical protein B7P10_02645 [Bordetella bronchiseptica]AZW10964.1 hypothetical protein CS344_02660 [Bordetella bronchiseptica]AZW20225.1 hypothetical protein CS345_02650 [Bordetella bronchiseptica]KCV54913.1 hypothetical protein AZ14_0442 [Bordetella bronchiseptica 980]